MKEQLKWILFLSGIFIFFLGLLNGFAIPHLTNRKAGLSGHLVALQGGMMLILFGFLWEKIHIGKFWLQAATVLSVYSIYGVWLGLMISASLGKSEVMALNFFINSLIYTSAVASIVSVLIIMAGMYTAWRSATSHINHGR